MADLARRRLLRGSPLPATEPRAGSLLLPIPKPGERLHEYVARAEPKVKLISREEYERLKLASTRSEPQSTSFPEVEHRASLLHYRAVGGPCHLRRLQVNLDQDIINMQVTPSMHVHTSAEDTAAVSHIVSYRRVEFRFSRDVRQPCIAWLSDGTDDHLVLSWILTGVGYLGLPR